MGATSSRITVRSQPGTLNNPKLPIRTRIANIAASKTPAGLAGQGSLVRPLPGAFSQAVTGTASGGAPRPQSIRTQKNPGHWHNPTGK